MSSTYLVIGASSGIGLRVTEKLLEENRGVISLSRNAPSLQNPNLQHYPCDVTDTDAEFPHINEPLSGLAYFPGSITLKPFKNLSKDDFLNDWQINFLGATQAIKNYLPQLEMQDGSSIVLMSTLAVQQGMPFHTSIAAAKGALEGFTLALAAELAPKVRVNAVAPSLTATPLSEHLTQDPKKKEIFEKRHPLKRLGTTDDLAEGVLFLLSERSSWMTGQVLHIDGGLSTLSSF
ncbi:SDR family NAD(P)-dependent oxidoreductase [Simkania sp.]|uniref:SDR family NAD(P)-dependent oxidoreductase n=1 Tax=Simkania sp. TaxID=34094 RepID=UPI003B51ECA5